MKLWVFFLPLQSTCLLLFVLHHWMGMGHPIKCTAEEMIAGKYHCFVSYIREKFLLYHFEYDEHCNYFVEILHQIKEVPFHSLFSMVRFVCFIYCKWVVIFFKCNLFTKGHIIFLFFVNFVNWIRLIDSQGLNHSCILRVNPVWPQYIIYIFFYIYTIC